MIIVTPTPSGSEYDMFTVSVITRDGVPGRIDLRSEQDNKVRIFTDSSIDFTFTLEEKTYFTDYILVCKVSELSLNEGDSFQLTIYDVSDNVMFKDKLYITLQKDEIDNNNGAYSINKDKYNSFEGSGDDFIVL